MHGAGGVSSLDGLKVHDWFLLWGDSTPQGLLLASSVRIATLDIDFAVFEPFTEEMFLQRIDSIVQILEALLNLPHASDGVVSAEFLIFKGRTC